MRSVDLLKKMDYEKMTDSEIEAYRGKIYEAQIALQERMREAGRILDERRRLDARQEVEEVVTLKTLYMDVKRLLNLGGRNG